MQIPVIIDKYLRCRHLNKPKKRAHMLRQANTGAAEGRHQRSADDPLRMVGSPAAAGAGKAEGPHIASGPAANEPEAEEEGTDIGQAGRAKGRVRATGRAAAAKGRRAKAGTASSPAEADAGPAADVPPAQPEKELAEPTAAAAQAQHSEYSFPDTAPDDILSVRAAGRASRLAAVSAAQKEPEQAADNGSKSRAGRRGKIDPGQGAGSKAQEIEAATPQVAVGKSGTAAGKIVEAEEDDGEQPDEAPAKVPKKATRKGRRTAKAAQPEAEAAPASARPKRGSKKTAAAEEAAAKEHSLSEVPDQADQAADEADVQQEADAEDPPQESSAGPGRGKKPSVPGRGKTGQKGKEKSKTDAAADTAVPQPKHTVSRATRAAQRKEADPEQADAGPASAPQQAKRSRRKAPVAASNEDAEEAEPEVTDSSAKQFAGLTESQAAADTLAKVSHCFTRCSACLLLLD